MQKPQSTRFEDIVVDGGGVSIKGSLEVDQNGDLINANFPTYSPSEGDKTSLKAERGADGVVKATMRGDVFDGRGFLKSAISGKEADPKSKTKNIDFDIDLKLGAVAGYNGEALRSVDAKMSRRNGVIKNFTLTGKVGRDTPVTAELRGRVQGQGREVIVLQTDDAGAFFRFTDTYSKMIGGQLTLAMEPPTVETHRQGRPDQRPRFLGQGRGRARARAAAGAPVGRAERRGVLARCARSSPGRSGQLTIRDGVVKGPTIGATIEGSIDYVGNSVRMSGTFVPMYGLNNMFGQVPVLGLFLGGGSNEGLIGVHLRGRRHAEPAGAARQPDLGDGARRAAQDIRVQHRQAEQPVELPPNNERFCASRLVADRQRRSAGTTRNGINPSTTLTSANAISGL